jgi:hypothetical protein
MELLAPRTLVLVACLGSLAACGPTYTMTPPTAFKRFEKARGFKLMTADGVALKAREVENYPRADLPFWTDALKRHLEARGYVTKGTACFKTTRGLDGCTLDFVLPHGVEDWLLSETVFVVDDRIVLVEAAGPYDRFMKVDADLKKALVSFDPGT